MFVGFRVWGFGGRGSLGLRFGVYVLGVEGLGLRVYGV